MKNGKFKYSLKLEQRSFCRFIFLAISRKPRRSSNIELLCEIIAIDRGGNPLRSACQTAGCCLVWFAHSNSTEAKRNGGLFLVSLSSGILKWYKSFALLPNEAKTKNDKMRSSYLFIFKLIWKKGNGNICPRPLFKLFAAAGTRLVCVCARLAPAAAELCCDVDSR